MKLEELLQNSTSNASVLATFEKWVFTVKTLADAIRVFTDQGAPIDSAAVAEMVGLPLRPTGSGNLGPLFAYHVQSGCFTKNEVRESTGRGPIDGGEEFSVAPAAAGAA